MTRTHPPRPPGRMQLWNPKMVRHCIDAIQCLLHVGWESLIGMLPAGDPISLFILSVALLFGQLSQRVGTYESIVHLGKTGLNSKAVSIFLFFSDVLIRTSVRVAVSWLHSP